MKRKLLFTVAILLSTVFAGQLCAQVPNAWQITDNSIAAGSAIQYTTNLPPDLQAAATNVGGGFRFSVNARFLTKFAGTKTMAMAYDTGPKRFLIWFNLSNEGDLTVELEGSPLALPPVVTGAASTMQYHTHEIVYNTTNASASYLLDGNELVSGWQGSANNLTPGQVFWGGGSSPGKGQMNFHSVSFAVTNTVVASYDAGTNGNPATAPDPVTQGWTVSTTNPAAGSFVTDVSPDTALLPVAITLPADQFTTHSAVLPGQANPSGSQTLAWFEWGTDTNYGNATAMQDVGAGLANVAVQTLLDGLVGGAAYHYRMVASNEFGKVDGANQNFFTPGFLLAPFPDSTIGGGCAAWGDYDNDGLLDFLRTGQKIGGSEVQLWHNTGSGFTNVTEMLAPDLPPARALVAWGDYDNDGYIDFALSGTTNLNTSNAVTQIWRNTGAGFTNVTDTIAPDLPGVIGSVAWGDYDNDGLLDLFLTGDSVSGYVSQIWRNSESGFSNVTDIVAPDLPPVRLSSVAWADFDNDGRLDFFLSGSINASYTPVSQLWRNTGSGFTNVTDTVAPGLPDVALSSVAWGDYDNDGRLDFLLSGGGTNVTVSQIWRNTGEGFSNVTEFVAPGLQPAYRRSMAWGDYDNDGRLDFLLTGFANTPSHSILEFWRNTGDGFTNVRDTVASNVPDVSDGSVAWGDYDNDGRLDFLLSGSGTNVAVSQIWHNAIPGTNTPPTAPTGLAMTATTNAVMLSWNSAADDHTPASGLTYNVRAGSTPGGIDLLAALVNATNGFRRVPAMGNAYLRHSLPLTGLTNGQTIYWSVQAVDTSFAGGSFATETSMVTIPTLFITTNSQPSTLNVFWTPPTWGWFLQEAPTVNGAWSNSASGSENPTSVSTTNDATFYRLFNP